MKNVPITELALLYLRHHHDDLNTPEDYVDEFNRVEQAMKEHLPKPKVSAVSEMVATPRRWPQ